MAGKSNGSSSMAMAVARIVVGIMFLFFAQYKLMGRDFAHGGYEHYVTGYQEGTAGRFFKTIFRGTVRPPGGGRGSGGGGGGVVWGFQVGRVFGGAVFVC